jgi:sugar phosphate isomerase/epimerase
MIKTRLTMLNSMAGADIEAALDRHAALGVMVLDLKDQLFGKGVADLTDAEAERIAASARRRGLTVHCLSTTLFYSDVEDGEAAFRERHLAKVDRVVAIAKILEPTFVRLLAASTRRRGEIEDSTAYLLHEHPWLFALYREAIDRVRTGGLAATIENEVGRCIFSKPAEVKSFFAALGRPGAVSFTYDVQNLWQMGTFPAAGVYEELKELIAYVHVKGGQREGTSTALRWASALEDASWPVLDIVRRVIADGTSPVICLNPSHGERKPGYDYTNVVERDLAFLRRSCSEIE